MADEDEIVCEECDHPIREEMSGKCHNCNARDFE